MIGGADNSPATGDAYMGAYKAIAWTGRAALREVLLSAGVRGHRRHDRVRRGRGAHQVPVVHRLLVPAGRLRLPDHRSLDLGRRLARDRRLLGLRRLHRRPQRRRLGRARRRHRARAAPRQVRRRRQGPSDSGSQHDLGRHRLLRAVARLVRVQSRLDDGRRIRTPSRTSS